MRILSGIVSATLLMPALALAEEAKEQQIHDKPAVRGSIIANLLQEHDNPFTLYPYDPNYLLYTDTSDINKEAIKTYNWADKARKDEVKYQLSLAFPLWRGIAGDSSVLGASYTQRSGGNCPTAASLRRSAKPTTSRSCSWGGRPITALPVGRCAMLKSALIISLTAARIRRRAAGIAAMRG